MGGAQKGRANERQKTCAVGLEMWCPAGACCWAPEIPSPCGVADPAPIRCKLAHKSWPVAKKNRPHPPASNARPFCSEVNAERRVPICRIAAGAGNILTVKLVLVGHGHGNRVCRQSHAPEAAGRMSDKQRRQDPPPCPRCGTKTKLGAVLLRTQSGKPAWVFGCGKCAMVVWHDKAEPDQST